MHHGVQRCCDVQTDSNADNGTVVICILWPFPGVFAFGVVTVAEGWLSSASNMSSPSSTAGQSSSPISSVNSSELSTCESAASAFAVVSAHATGALAAPETEPLLSDCCAATLRRCCRWRSISWARGCKRTWPTVEPEADDESDDAPMDEWLTRDDDAVR